MVYKANAISCTKRLQPSLRRYEKSTEPLPSLLDPHSPITSPSPIPFSIKRRRLLDKVHCWMRLAAVDGVVTRTQPQWVQHEDTKTMHELFVCRMYCQGAARSNQSTPNEDDMILSFCPENPQLRTQQWPRYKFPLVKFNSGAARPPVRPPLVTTPRWHRKDVGMTSMWVKVAKDNEEPRSKSDTSLLWMSSYSHSQDTFKLVLFTYPIHSTYERWIVGKRHT